MSEFFDVVLEFLGNYWYLIPICISIFNVFVVILFNIIIFVINNKKSLNIILWKCLARLPELISSSELLGGTGEMKFSRVFAAILDDLCTSLNIDEKVAVTKYGSIINSQIENILSTPQKKGVYYEKNNEKAQR